jgi:hypothetical protein
MNNLSPIEKLVLSFLCAFSAPWVVALVFGAIFNNLLVMLCIGFGLSFWTLKFGFQKNGELENSIGGLFESLTNWVIPSGISWWFPRPFGKALRKMSIEKKVLERRVSSGNAFEAVKTKDGGIVEVGVVLTSHIVNARNAANYQEGDLQKQVDSLLDRAVRMYALYWDSDESHDTRPNTALSGRKSDFSAFLMGATDITDRDGNIIPNNTQERLKVMGVQFDNVDVVDVNEPAEVQKARNEAAAEPAQAQREQRDAKSMRDRTLEMMWGTSDQAAIAVKITNGEKPLVSSEDALTAVRTARGDLSAIHVSGNAGDFTKGAAVQSQLMGKGKKK